MKRWVVRIALLVVVTGGGWYAVSWAQQHLGSQNAPAFDPSKPPVNAESAAAWNESQRTSSPHIGQQGSVTSTMASTRTTVPSDPFQNVTLASGQQPVGTQRGGGDRYGGVEPRAIDVDPNAAPIQTDTPYHGSMKDDIPSPAEVGLASNRTVSARADDIPTAPNDPLGLQAAGATAAVSDTSTSETMPMQISPPQTTNGLRIIGASARQGSPSANSADTVNDPRTAGQSPHIGASDQYMRSGPAAGDYQRQTPATAKFDEPATTPISQSGPNAGSLNNSFPSTPAMASARGNPSPSTITSPIGSASDNLMHATIPDSMPAQPTAAAADVNVEGLGRPGEKRLEGPQNPSVTIEKIAPPEIQVNKPATFQVVVRNNGQVPAENVEVTDVVPQGTQLISTTPRTSVGQRGEILWKVGDLKPSEEAKLQIELMPLSEGEIGSTAVVQFRSTASMRTIATKPEIVLELSAPKQVMIAEDAKLKIKISNPGTGAAGKLVLQAKVPSGFQHPAGSDLEFDVGQFKPGESRELDLALHAVQAGQFTFVLGAQGDANLHVEKTANIEVIAPALQVQVSGPSLRYLDRQAKYTVTVANPGTAPARNINLTTRLPKGMQFVEASDSGRYDAATSSVMWALDELPPGQSGSVSLTTLAKDAGEQKLRGEVKAAGGLSETTEQVTMVEGVAAVLFTVADVDDPVEVGGNATYEIHVVNQGSKAAGRLQIAAVMPPEIKPISGDGPSRGAVDGQRIVFEPMTRLAPKADVTYKVVGQCLSPGDLRVQVLLQTDEMAKPVVKEESTRVYKD